MPNDSVIDRHAKKLRLHLDNAKASLATGKLDYVQSGYRSAIAAKEMADFLSTSFGAQWAERFGDLYKEASDLVDAYADKFRVVHATFTAPDANQILEQAKRSEPLKSSPNGAKVPASQKRRPSNVPVPHRQQILDILNSGAPTNTSLTDWFAYVAGEVGDVETDQVASLYYNAAKRPRPTDKSAK